MNRPAPDTRRTTLVHDDAAGVVLGFGAAVDCEIRWDAAVLADLAEAYAVEPGELVAPAGPILSERDLVVSILGYVSRSAGGERRVDEPEVIKRFCARFANLPSLGGTCVRAAAAMQRLGVGATVHLAFDSPQVRALMPAGTAALLPEEEHDSYPHLIVQYPAGTRLVTSRLDLVTTRANRLIYVNDPANELLDLSPALGAAVSGARVFLISGLNAMRSRAALGKRLDVIEEAIRARAGEGFVMYEDAGFHEPDFAAVVRRRMARLADVYSLSDEELAEAVGGLAQDAEPGGSCAGRALGEAVGQPLDLLAPEAVLRAVSTLSTRLGVPVVVVHSRHWVLAFGHRAAQYAPALATGVALATARYAYGEAADQDRAREVGLAPVDPAVAAFVARLIDLAGDRITCVPVPVTDVPDPTTVGLGDTFVGGFVAAVADPSVAVSSAPLANAVHAHAQPATVPSGEAP